MPDGTTATRPQGTQPLREVDDIAQQVAPDIRTQYTLEYHTTNAPTNGGYRKIRVEAKEKGFHNL